MKETIARSRPESRTQPKHKHYNKVLVKSEEMKQIRKENVDMTDYILYIQGRIDGTVHEDIMTYKQWIDLNGR